MDVVCFSHLRWNFVYQRPQHLMSRFARQHRVFFIEEPVYKDGELPHLVSARIDAGLTVITPILSPQRQPARQNTILQHLLDALLLDQDIRHYVVWYYTPMALGITRRLHPLATVYDCMDQLSAFRGSPASLLDHEVELFHRADLVFVGGKTLFEDKRGQHPSTHLFPSSIDAEHFRRAREKLADPADQKRIGRPRIGYCGVIDERLDADLLDRAAAARPDWNFVMVGPIVKVTPAELPHRDNIHYLGQKSYGELPSYLSNWDAAMMPFARNEATRYISPTKTPEYLAAGLPVVSTRIQDVVRPYGERGWVYLADDQAEFDAAIQRALEPAPAGRQEEIDRFLALQSWDQTWKRMQGLIEDAVQSRTRRRAQRRRLRAGR